MNEYMPTKEKLDSIEKCREENKINVFFSINGQRTETVSYRSYLMYALS